jgi:hypothetical protein
MKSLARTRLLGIFCAELRANSIVCRTAPLFSPKRSVTGVTSPRELRAASHLRRNLLQRRSLGSTLSPAIFCRESQRKPFIFSIARFFSLKQSVIGVTSPRELGAASHLRRNLRQRGSLGSNSFAGNILPPIAAQAFCFQACLLFFAGRQRDRRHVAA